MFWPITKFFTNVSNDNKDQLEEKDNDVVVKHYTHGAYRRYSPHMLHSMETRFKHLFPAGYTERLRRGNINKSRSPQ
jgi:hypothetical protein